MKTISISEKSRDNILHVEAPGCIINIRVGLTDMEGRPTTSIEILADDYAGEEWRIQDTPHKLYKSINIRVKAYPNIRQQQQVKHDAKTIREQIGESPLRVRRLAKSHRSYKKGMRWQVLGTGQMVGKVNMVAPSSEQMINLIKAWQSFTVNQ